MDQDKCPICKNGSLELRGSEEYEGGKYYQVKCPECGFEGQQHYKLIFTCFTDNDGKEI